MHCLVEESRALAKARENLCSSCLRVHENPRLAKAGEGVSGSGETRGVGSTATLLDLCYIAPRKLNGEMPLFRGGKQSATPRPKTREEEEQESSQAIIGDGTSSLKQS